ncbi:glycosyltransferase family 2 protein [Chakrabartyella piscis]|uniref:glycosyltransferase family 2 protein n=1 Tax=Chakrabartyella piscis TaxID=2918914 RepID=UPI00295839A3|nr:glycosyltransferase family 2 protein [Chakrabartyella piscis]
MKQKKEQIQPKHVIYQTIKRKSSFFQNLFLMISLVLMLIYLCWRVFFTLPLEDGIANVIFGVLLVGAEVITCFTTFELFYRKFRASKGALEFPQVADEFYPHIDVFIATHNEPLDILYKTANACTFMEYPDKNKVHIYFCDDGNRPAVAELAESLGIGYLGLANNKHAKSGNLNNALSKTDSPLIATFDADMIPQRTFLMKTVPYFFLSDFIDDNGIWRNRREDERDETFKLGLVQTPQSFYNPDLFQFNLYAENTVPNEQDFFSKEVNVMRNSSNAVSYTGSNTVISRQAMMDIGGFPTKTITEDFEVSIRMQQEQYVTYATSEVQAAGLTVTDVKGMLKQRKRWARGIIQSLYNTKAIFSSKLPMAGRITYLTAYLYWWSFFNRLIFILAPILFALFDFRVVNCSFEELLILWLPAYICYSASFRFLSSNVRTNRWSQTIDTIFAPYLIGCVFLETLGIRETKFKVTSKEHVENSSMVYATPHIILIVMSVLAMIRFIDGKYGWILIYSSVIIFWLAYNMISLIYAVFFMAGRKAYRKSERIKAKEKVKVYSGDVVYEAETVDLSDGGMQFWSTKAIYIPEDKPVKVVVESDHYRSEWIGKTVYVKRVYQNWHYAMEIETIDEANKRQFMQLIYDRAHSLPKETDKWNSVFDDMKRNVLNRLVKPEIQRRKYARIDIGQRVVFEDGAMGYIHDFNFKYFTISDFVEKQTSEEELYELRCPDGTVMQLLNTHKSVEKYNATLFQVMNLEQLTLSGVNLTKTIDALIAS